MDAYNSNLDCTETINQFGVERPLFGWYECERLTHSQQQSQAPNAHKKEANNQTDLQSHNALGPPKLPSSQVPGLD